ncbi:cation diffusion facilitator family transporter [Alkaliphilus serpentinus]|uniref:Cation transporter n=1 Tax=Alkaliphilus serpentinus TaxID=1482731 RepID=A0A833HNN8_9FIRM|nr:cation diffusion facilitator family transporter [Alkaliphilus serpentinus]KAB3529017.1 cation transporter [Alkaliphilus serpentinus]
MQDQQRYQEVKRVSIVSIIGNVVLTIIKAVIGIISGSTALFADSIHSASDVFGTIVLLQGLRIAHMPPDESHPYGHHKAESITSKLLAIILVVTALGIGNEAIKVLRSQDISPPGIIAVYTAIVSIVIKEGMYRYVMGVGKRIKSQAVIADAWQNRSDAFSSVATLIGVGGSIAGYPFMDPLAGIFVSLMILKTGVSIYIDAIKGLMDTAPEGSVIEDIAKLANEAEGVISVQDVKVRQYGAKYHVDMKICVDPKITVEEGHGAAARAKENIMKNREDILDVLIHVNPCPNLMKKYRDE